jgi:hypothetical protein
MTVWTWLSERGQVTYAIWPAGHHPGGTGSAVPMFSEKTNVAFRALVRRRGRRMRVAPQATGAGSRGASRPAMRWRHRRRSSADM